MEFSLSIPNPKTQKSQFEGLRENEDIISRLPDELISHILSFLPTKEAQRTGILSNRWKYIWAFLPTLIFTICSNWTRSEFERYMDFMDKILVLHNGMTIPRFQLSISRPCDDARIYAVISAVLKCNVQEMFICFRPTCLGFPWEHFRVCKTLVALTLSGHFRVDVPENVLFPSLKSLHLNCVDYSSDAAVVNLFSGCTALETLCVERLINLIPGGMKTFKIQLPSLKKLCLWFSRGLMFIDTGYKVVVDAPNLEYIDFEDLLSQEFSFKKFPSLVDAHICVDIQSRRGSIESGDSVVGLLRSISAVKRLSLAQSTLMAIGFSSNLNLPTFYNLVRLVLGFNPVWGWWFLPHLLEFMPNLQHVCLSDGSVPLQPWLREQFRLDWNPPPEVPNCLLFKIKRIKINNHAHVSFKELDMVEYLLKNAEVLEIMTIKCGNDPRIREKLLNFQRGSTSCELKFI